MGSGESTRRVTVERDRDTGSVGIIKVSENVVRQLRGEKELPLETDEPLTKDDINRLWQELQHEKSHLDHQKQHLQEILQRAFDEGRQVEAKRLQKESKATEKMSTKDRADLENQITQMGKETEKRDDENLAEMHYLREKVAQQEKITSEHFQEAVEEVRKKFSQSMRTPICQNLHNEVLKCYKQYPTESLRCSQQVREFVHCVEQSRLAFLQESK